MSFVPRIRLRGKRPTEKQIIDEITGLLHGNGARPYPLSAIEIAKHLGVNKGTVYNYIKRMKSLEKSRTGRFKLPKIPHEKQFIKFNKLHKITSEPLVAEWLDDKPRPSRKHPN